MFRFTSKMLGVLALPLYSRITVHMLLFVIFSFRVTTYFHSCTTHILILTVFECLEQKVPFCCNNYKFGVSSSLTSTLATFLASSIIAVIPIAFRVHIIIEEIMEEGFRYSL